LWRKDGEIWGG
jgi:hypothetical protein